MSKIISLQGQPHVPLPLQQFFGESGDELVIVDSMSPAQAQSNNDTDRNDFGELKKTEGVEALTPTDSDSQRKTTQVAGDVLHHKY